MSGRPTWQEARRLAFGAALALPAESVPLTGAIGRRLAADLAALVDLPHYASSAMDGWGVAGDPPWTVVSSAAELAPGRCLPVRTGGEIPVGVDAVLRSEHALPRQDGTVVLNGRTDSPRPGEHIRGTGTEAVRGEIIVNAGAVLNPARIALVAAAGHDELRVLALPRVALVLTGDEVVGHGIPGPGRVRDGFGPVLPALLGPLGARWVSTAHLPDSRARLVAEIRSSASTADAVVTTGGTGGSDADHLRAALAELGATVLIEGVRMRPGGPALLARLPEGRFLVGLPGNPLAATMGLLSLAAPLFAALGGAPEPPLKAVVAGEAIAGHPDATVLVPYRLIHGRAVPVRHRGAAMMRGIAEADGVLVVSSEVQVGQELAALPLPWRS